ncbi:hypothetical protein [Arthrobacter sp. B10-11]|uniref:hypothetical protein n=1 Tax=Arthrobacter sp. B10-11 TaxID=3081160 RepID=UPI00295455AE|nr:hypothetical protein [Arthrobacter sp. B10-11]MDV8148935.1 hypothetical protein [Arthrobacter sp. B10-11]
MKLQPTPAQAMALLASGLLEVDDFPDVAAQWLAYGMDSESLRMLAGADQEDRADIRDLWTAALEELDIQPIPVENRWPLIWAYELATWKAGERTKEQGERCRADVEGFVEAARKDIQAGIRGRGSAS